MKRQTLILSLVLSLLATVAVAQDGNGPGKAEEQKR